MLRAEPIYPTLPDDNRAVACSGDVLTAFLKQSSRREFVWGNFDCAMFIADWISVATGKDPAYGWRESYKSYLGSERIIRQRGGLVAHFDQCLSPLDFARTLEPRRGDVAVVEAAEGQTGGIVLGSTMVAMLTGPGIIARRLDFAPIVAAWRIE